MGDTGSELAGVILVIFLVFGVVAVVGFKIIDRVEKKRLAGQPGNTPPPSKINLPLILALIVPFLIIAIVLTLILRPNPPIYNIQQRARIGDWVIEVQNFDMPGKTLPSVASEKGAAPGESLQASGNWLEVKVDLTNAGLKNLSQTLNDFEIQDSQNDAFLPDTAAPALAYTRSKSNTTPQDSLAPGKETSFWILYDIPANISGLELVFKQGPNPRFRLTTGTAR
jgi:hypothetical protein